MMIFSNGTYRIRLKKRISVLINWSFMMILLTAVGYAEETQNQGVTAVYWKHSVSGIPKMAFIRRETGDLNFDLSQVPLMQKGAKFDGRIISITYRGILTPESSGKYAFDTSHKQHTELKLDGKTIQIGQWVDLKSDESVILFVQYNVQNDGKPLQIKWQQKGYEAEIIKAERIQRKKNEP